MKKEKHFIATTDSETADTLRKLGFKEITSTNSNYWTFINEPNKIMFSSDDVKVNYTDKLTF